MVDVTWRAVTSAPSYSREATRVGLLGSLRSYVNTRVRADGDTQGAAAAGSSTSPPMTTARSPDSSSRGSPIRPSGAAPSRCGAGPLRASVNSAPFPRWTRRSPWTLATSGSSTFASCTLVPVLLPVCVSSDEVGAGATESWRACGSAAEPASTRYAGRSQPQAVTRSSPWWTYQSSSWSQLSPPSSPVAESWYRGRSWRGSATRIPAPNAVDTATSTEPVATLLRSAEVPVMRHQTDGVAPRFPCWDDGRMTDASPPNSSSDRELDLVLFGATGFTGRLTAQYLARHAPRDLRWALAGRSPGKLEAVRDHLASIRDSLGDLPLLTADVTDDVSLKDLANRARVVITTVGPYLMYGEPLVAACSEAGTDYVDLTGEPEFVDRMYLAHHQTAVQTGARLVHACGFDSIPHDLGAYFTVRQLPDDVPITLRGVVRAGGMISGGTFHTTMNGLARVRSARAAM